MEKKRLSLQAEDDIVYAEYLARRPRRRHAEDDVRISRRDAKDVQPGVGYFIYASGNRKTCAVALHQVRREMTITR